MPSTRRRRAGPAPAAAAFAAAAIVLVSIAVGASIASAAATASVDRQAWSATGPLAPLGAQDANVYVSAVAGQEQARAFVRLATAGATESALVDANVVLGEAGDGVMPASALLHACAMTTDFTGTGRLTEASPRVDCTLSVAMTRAPDGSWTVPLGVFAHVLAAGTAYGVALLPDLDGAPPAFTVSFDTTKTRVDAPGAATAPSSGTGGPEPSPSPSPAAASTGSVGAVPVQSGNVTFDTALPPSVNPPAVAAPQSPRSPSDATSATRPPAKTTTAPGHVSSTPPTLVIVLPMLLVALALWARGRWLPPVLLPGAAVGTGTAISAAVGAGGVAWMLLASEVVAYKLGLIAIVFVGAIGLHILVNWAGELSLAHAAFIGLPAFVVAQVSSHAGVSPIAVVPLGVVVGAALGLVVAVAALRARGLQVALVTLAVGIAVDRFFFVRGWIIGPSGGLRVQVPSLFGVRFATSRSLVPVLVVIVLIAIVACRALLGSKVGRALSLIRADPAAAGAVGIPVTMYRGVVYLIAGSFAGLAGSCYVLWVQRVSPKGFPLDLGFTYLVIAVLAGKGGLGGLGLSAVLLEGGALFSILPQNLALYLGPIALIFNVTRYQEGFNGVLRETSHRYRQWRGATVSDIEDEVTSAPTSPSTSQSARSTRGIAGTSIRLPVVIASVVVVAGFAAMALAWYHAGNTDQLWIQNQEIVSGGLGGLSLIVFGSMLLVRDALLNGSGVVARRELERDAA